MERGSALKHACGAESFPGLALRIGAMIKPKSGYIALTDEISSAAYYIAYV
jgi:hypothetical protein